MNPSSVGGPSGQKQQWDHKMRMWKIFVVALAALSMAALSAPTLAKGPSANGQVHSNKGGAVRGLDRANAVAGTHGQAGRANAASHHSGIQGSNKGGAVRGLDRANTVAGSHGQVGRVNAANHH